MHNEEQKESRNAPSNTTTPSEIIIGNLISIDSHGRPLVDFPDNAENHPIVAISTLGLSQQKIGRQVALLFVNGDHQKPIIMGLINDPLQELIENFEANPIDNDIDVWPQKNIHNIQQRKKIEPQTTIDGERLVLEGKNEIVLKCGDASITLTKEGKIMIRGKYLLNESKGVVRIIGGSVAVN